jgi:hypothetical protein
MNEADIRRKLQRTLIAAGFEEYHPPDIQQTETARPDILSINGFVIEVKRIDSLVRETPWFDPAKISNGQRKHLDYYYYDRRFPCFLAIGTTFTPYRLWVVPWFLWNKLEKTLSQEGLNLDFRITLTELETNFSTYELYNKTPHVFKTTEFTIPAWHPLQNIPRLPRRNDEWGIYSIRFPEDPAQALRRIEQHKARHARKAKYLYKEKRED